MAVSVTHTKVSTIPDGGDTDLVRPSDWNDEHDVTITATDISAAPDDVNYLVGTASGSLSAEIVVGTSPGGELGGTWASPTVDATHAGSTHGAAVTTHEAAADPHTGYVREDLIDAQGDLYVGSADNTVAKLTKGTAGQFLQAGASTLAYADIFIPVTFSKSGALTVTSEVDTPPPFRWYNDSGRTLTFAAARATATDGPTGADTVIDLNVDGTTVFGGGTKIVIPDGSFTVKQTTFSTTTVADGHYLSVNIDATGSAATCTITVWLKG